jgi:hypothetical protein
MDFQRATELLPKASDSSSILFIVPFISARAKRYDLQSSGTQFGTNNQQAATGIDHQKESVIYVILPDELRRILAKSLCAVFSLFEAGYGTIHTCHWSLRTETLRFRAQNGRASIAAIA